MWEELAGANVAALECCDQLCQSLKWNKKPFGGIPFIGIGDFRQVAPVIKGQGLTPALHASVKSSDTWPAFKILTVHHPFRRASDPAYTNFVDLIGEDYNHPTTSIDILEHITSIDEAIQFLYPTNILRNPTACLKRAFLSPKNFRVDEFNQQILHRLPGDVGKTSTNSPTKYHIITIYQYPTTVETLSKNKEKSLPTIRKQQRKLSRSSINQGFRSTTFS